MKSSLVNRNAALVTVIAIVVGGVALASSRIQSRSQSGVTRVAVEFSGGHETDPRDRGRPVILVASALGVQSKVFREAFSHVHPAPAGMRPTPEEARANKDALMSALEKYDVTNDRLDEVSNYYRYVRSRGELWPNTPAVVNALVKNGVVTGFEVVKGGSGYSSEPTVSVPGAKFSGVKVKLAFGKEFDRNGSVSSITIVKGM